MSRNLSHLSNRQGGLDNNLFDRLGKLAKPTGTPSAEALEQLAEEFMMGTANTYGTATFYDFLKPENQGKRVYVCNGSACRTAGTQDTLYGAIKEHVPVDQIGHMCCLGRCHENKAFHVGGRNYSGPDADNLQEILTALPPVEKAGAGLDTPATAEASDNKRYRVAALGPAFLTAAIPDLHAFYAPLKALLIDGSEEARDRALAAVELSGLRGRGGAGFPIAIKMKTVREMDADTKFVVCNADEGDPGAYTDRYLLEQQAHRVLYGMLLSGFITGASHGVLYIRGEYPESIAACQQALAELADLGLAAHYPFAWKVIHAQGAYICGEETAMLASLEGQRPEVRVRPPFPAQEGLFRKPTLVNNVETLAALPAVWADGSEQAGAVFAAEGRGQSTGTKLLSLDGHFNTPGVYEVSFGTPLRTVVDELGGGFNKPVKAMHIGGPLGGLVPTKCIDDLTVDFESFKEHGFLLGHTSVLCIPEDYPLLDYLEHLFHFTAEESCGKCFPCRLGSVRGRELLSRAAHGEPVDRALFNDLLDTLQHGSLCALGGGLPLPVRNALQHFADELKPYFTAEPVIS